MSFTCTSHFSNAEEDLKLKKTLDVTDYQDRKIWMSWLWAEKVAFYLTANFTNLGTRINVLEVVCENFQVESTKKMFLIQFGSTRIFWKSKPVFLFTHPILRAAVSKYKFPLASYWAETEGNLCFAGQFNTDSSTNQLAVQKLFLTNSVNSS